MEIPNCRFLDSLALAFVRAAVARNDRSFFRPEIFCIYPDQSGGFLSGRHLILNCVVEEVWNMRHIAFPLLLIAAFYCCPVLGQKGPCTEDSIRAEFNSGSRPARTDDFYLFNPLLEKPAVGLEDLKKAQRTMATQSANRKNAKAETKLVACRSEFVSTNASSGV